jgi:hypothetical protein
MVKVLNTQNPYTTWFIIEPFIMGTGRRFFPDGTPPTKLKLVESKTLGAGSLAVVYRPAGK